jgi:hypothetical protein
MSIKDAPVETCDEIPALAPGIAHLGCMSQQLSTNDRVRAQYAGEAARRRLGELRPCLQADVMEFAKSGKAATAKSVGKWLKSRGTFGAVASYVAEILANLKDANAALAQFA